MNDRMHQPDQPSSDREELRDRLIDAALRERLGGETPPDLSAAILAKASAAPAITSSTQEATMSNSTLMARLRTLRNFSIAATLLIAAGLLLMPSVQAPPEAARRSMQQRETPASGPSEPGSRTPTTASDSSGSGQNQPGDMQNGLPSPYHLTDDVQHFEPGHEFNDNSPTASNNSTVPDYTVDLDIPFRQGSFDLATPQFKDGALIQGAGAEQSSPRANANARALSSMHTDYGYGDAAKSLQGSGGEPGSSPTRSGLANEAGVGQGPESSAKKRPLSVGSVGEFAATNEPLAKPSTTAPFKNEVQPSGAQIGLQALINVPPQGIDDAPTRIAPSNRDQYARITENPFLPVSAANTDHRLSTFSIDVDTASYANVRQFLTQSGMLPPPDAVRIEELVNYFDYAYTPPTGDVPFAAHVEVAGCPWAPEHRLVRVGIKGREIERTQRPLSNLVFLIDVSGSMNEPNKLPLLVEGMKRLTRELGENDRVAIVVYASSEGLALESTPGTDQSKIIAALDQLQAGGSTAGGAGIQLAYQVAQQNFIKGAVNRVILCTDGDFNVGVTSPAELERMAETNAKETGVFLTVLGFGRGNLNDAMMEQVADKGNGNYHYIDTRREAGKVLVEEMSGTLVTIAKDVKIQIEFNPAHVAGYRLIGYENRVLAAEDFNDDKKDAGEIGAGHTVTALYEIIPVGAKVPSTSVDELKYAPGAEPLQRSAAPDDKTPSDAEASDELLTLKIRYKAPDGDKSSKLEFPIVDAGGSFAQASDDFKFASAVASFGMLLRNSEYKGNATYAGVIETAAASKDHDPHGYRQEFVEIAKRAKELTGE